MRLPDPLRRWTPLLDIFPRRLAQALGEMLGPLRAAVGPLSPGPGGGDGDPDGYDGIVSRGGYERLLASEWLLAAEMPEEFLRRAAMHEHAFLAPARRSPRVRRICAVVFDAGPDQLGAARIAHIAILIVLARRAEEAGWSLEWGVLQQEAEPFTEVSATTLGCLLGARTFQGATAENGERWRSRWGRRAGELWGVGAAIPGAFQISIREARDGDGGRRLLCTLEGKAPRREVHLPLPSSEDCVRLLREPLRTVRPGRAMTGRTRALPTSPLVFVDRGHRVCGRGPGNEVLVFHVPGSANEKQQSGHRIEVPHRPIAVGGYRRSYTVVSWDGEALHLHSVGRQAMPMPSGPCLLPEGVEAPGEGFLACSTLRGTGSSPHVLLVLGGTLLRISPLQAPAARVQVEARNVRGALFLGPDVVVMQRQASGLDAVIALDGRPHPVTLSTVECEGSCRFGFGGPMHLEPFGMLAMEQTDGRWDVLFRDARYDKAACVSIGVPPDAEVIGPVSAPLEPTLLVLAADRRTVLACRSRKTKVLTELETAAAIIVGCPFRGVVAWSGEGLEVADAPSWRTIARWPPQ
jgi:hypothetical protein